MLAGLLLVYSLMRYFEIFTSWKQVVHSTIWTTILAGVMRRYLW